MEKGKKESGHGISCEIEVRQEAEASLPTAFGDFRIIYFSNSQDKKDHVALVKGKIKGMENVLVRVHSKCLTGDSFGSIKCDCRAQLEGAMKKIEGEGAGAIIYLDQEGRGIGLMNKIKAYALQDTGLDTVEANLKLGLKADERNFHIAARIIESLGVKSIRLMTNNPEKLKNLKMCGIKVIERVPSITKPTSQNKGYLNTKKDKFGHLISDAI